MKRTVLSFTTIIVSVLLTATLISCSKNDEPVVPESPVPEELENVVLVYAASGNDLYSNMLADKAEMLRGLKDTDTSKSRLLLFETIPGNVGSGRQAILWEAVRNKKDNSFYFKELKSFSADVFTTDPQRLSEVVAYAKEMRKADTYGLIFWSHGGGWEPGNSEHTYPDDSSNQPVAGDIADPDYWWGVDISGDNVVSDKMNIDELAAALPDNGFHFIWFDCCYMSSIEVAYQLRNKTDFFVAYPTEIYNPGLNYETAIPYLMNRNPDLEGAARSLYDYYTYFFSPEPAAVTVGVFDMSRIEEIARIARQAFSSFVAPPSSELICYSRRGLSANLYDFRQYMSRGADIAGNTIDTESIEKAFTDFTVCKFASERDFNNKLIPSDGFSGLSTYIYRDNTHTSLSDYYRRLDWFNAVYPH